MNACDDAEPCKRWWQRTGAPQAGFVVLLIGLALLSTRPLILQSDSAILVGHQPAATVPLFNVWTVWWNTDRLAHGLSDYWHAPIFHPTAGTFAFSEAQPATLLVAPLVWLGSPTLAYNAYLLLAVVLNGWCGYRLLRTLGHADLIAMTGGVMCLLLPFVFWQIAVLQLVPLWGVLWTLTALHRLSEKPGWKTGVSLGGAFGVTYLLCNYYGLFLSVLLATCAPWLIGRRWLNWRTWVAIGLSITVAGCLVAPVVWAQLHYLMQHKFEREMFNVVSLSTTWRDFLLPTGVTWIVDVASVNDLGEKWRLSAGPIKTLLAGCGLLAGLFTPSRRRMVCFWGLLLAASILLASATKVSVESWTLQSLLVRHWPGFAQIRTPYRFAVFAQIATVVLATECLMRLWTWLARTTRERTAVCVTAVLAMLAVTDVLPRLSAIESVPEFANVDHWAHWLRDHTPERAVVVGIPFVHRHW